MNPSVPSDEVQQHRLSHERPLPTLYPWNRPFFEGGTEGKLVLQRCSRCSQLVYYPRMVCPNCLSGEYVWEQMSGEGVVYSFAIIWRPHHPAFADQIPINLAVVELSEGPQMVTTVVNCLSGSMRIGMEVSVLFETVADGIALPKFAPRRSVSVGPEV